MRAQESKGITICTTTLMKSAKPSRCGRPSCTTSLSRRGSWSNCGAAMKADVRPVAEREREALRWAINYFRNCAADLKPEGSQRKFNELTKHMWEDLADEGPEALHREFAGYMDDLGRGKDYSFELFYLAATLIERGDPLPGPLRPYIADFLRNPKMKMNRRPGRKAS